MLIFRRITNRQHQSAAVADAPSGQMVAGASKDAPVSPVRAGNEGGGRTSAAATTKDAKREEEEEKHGEDGSHCSIFTKKMTTSNSIGNPSSTTTTSQQQTNTSSIVITTEPTSTEQTTKKQQNGFVAGEGEEKCGAHNGKPPIFRREDDWTEKEIVNWCPNDYEKNLVKCTWSDDFDFLYELGTTIYTYIFEHNPQAKQLFVKIHRHGDNWKQSAEFRTQALKFVQTISYTAKNLYHMEECIQPRLFEIGENHVKYASRGFKTEHWDIFLDAMEFALTNHIAAVASLNAQQRADAARVWRQLAHYIIVHMKRGYLAREAATNRREKNYSTAASSESKHRQDSIL